MSIAPERVWLEDEFGDDDPDQWGYGTWDIRNMDGYVHEYIRADIYAAALTREAVLREALRPLVDHPAFDRDYISADLRAKLDAAIAALGGKP